MSSDDDQDQEMISSDDEDSNQQNKPIRKRKSQDEEDYISKEIKGLETVQDVIDLVKKMCLFSSSERKLKKQLKSLLVSFSFLY